MCALRLRLSGRPEQPVCFALQQCMRFTAHQRLFREMGLSLCMPELMRAREIASQ